jgi:uncharacterized protein DUF3644
VSTCMEIDLPITLRKGKAKSILESSIDSALLAIEIYNKPRTAFRSEGYITMMVIAWTKLFHAYFQATIGNKYYYKESTGRYKKKNGEKLAWELTTCINQYDKLNDTDNLPEPVVKNIKFFIAIRNKIEHRHINKKEVDVSIFGECQSFLFNYESLLIKLFGEDHALHESLVFALQLSHIRQGSQIKANKSALAKDVQDIKKFIDDYRTSLSEEVFHAPEFSIKLMAIPKVSNTNRGDVAIEFIPLSQLAEEDRKMCESIGALIKDKRVTVEGRNIGKFRPGAVCTNVNEKLGSNDFKVHIHTWLTRIFKIRPKAGAEDPFDTNTKYCHYDEAHNDYLYNEDWVDFIVNFFAENKMTVDQLRETNSKDEALLIKDYI